MIGVSNPIEGTVLDPKRKAWLRMQDAGMGGDAEGADYGPPEANTDLGFTDPNAPVVNDGTPDRASGIDIPNPASARAAMGPGRYPMDERLPDGTPAIMAGIGRPSTLSTPTPQVNNDGSGADAQEDAFYKKMMATGMEDTPSQGRVKELEAQLHHAPMSKKQAILKALMLAAPMVVGGLIGGAEGIEGAGEGTLNYVKDERERNIQHDTRLRAELESERGRQERQYERRMQIPVQYENMRMRRELQKENSLYKQGMLGVAGRNADTNASKAKVTASRGDLAWYKQGLDPVTHQPLDMASLPLSVQGQVKAAQATTELREAQEELARAKATAEPQKIQVARDRLAKAGQNHDLALRTFMRDTYGTDVEGTVLPGTPLVDDGQGNDQPIGWKAAPNVRPSGQSRSRGDQADVIIQAGDDLAKYIDANRAEIGNFSSYWDQYINDTPIANPKAAETMARLGSYAALQPAFHGFRGQDALREFTKMIGGIPKDADSLIASIRGIRGTAQIGSKVGKLKVATGGGAVQKLQKSGGGGGGSTPGVIKWGTDAQGNPVRLSGGK